MEICNLPLTDKIQVFLLQSYCKGTIKKRDYKSNLVKKGADTAEIKELLKSVLNEAFYTILMGLDGEASLGDMQMQFSIYDEDNVLIDDIESYAYDEFMSDM